MLSESSDAIYILLTFLGVLLYVLLRNYWIRCALYFYTSELVGLFVPAAIAASIKYQNGLLDVVLKICKHYHPMGKIWFGCGLHVVSDPETVELLLKKHLSKGQFYEHMKTFVGNSMITAPVDLWKKHKKILLQTFGQNILNAHLDSFVRHSKIMSENLQGCQNVQVDVHSEFFRCFFGIMSEFTMGKNVSVPIYLQDEFMAGLQRGQIILGQRNNNPFLHAELLWKLFGHSKEEHYLSTKLMNHARNIVKEFEAKKTIDDSKKFLNLMMESRDKQGLWSNEELVQELVSLLIASIEGSASLNSFVILMLAIHQDVQKKVHQELFEIFGKSGRDVTLEDLDKMNYLEQVISETLRLFPPIPIILRKLEEGLTLGHHIIRSGSSCLIPIISIQRNATYWPDTLRFDPDRFLPEEVAKRPRYAFMPYSVPPRNCMGMKFSEMSTKAVLSTVLRNFEVYTKQYSSVEDITLNMHIFLSAPNGYNVTLVPKLK